ncbi:MAG TPA: RNase adapter RapZ [Aliiroseovarius sp.]|nr:RNase adapter RapZ [Aliiroseovarius sp.]
MIIVTGPSGAGRTTAVNALEDFGFEVIDNIPLSLIPRLLAGPPLSRPLALGLDTRNREFTSGAVLNLVAELAGRETLACELMYLDCRPGVLINRYSETRRRHPLAEGENPAHGIERELELMAPLRARADILIDTSLLTPHDLRDEIRAHLSVQAGEGLTVTVQSFSYKRGAPRGLDLVFDTRFLRNPHWSPELRALTGQDNAVGAYIEADTRFRGFLDRLTGPLGFLLPAYAEEGKSHLSIGIGCTGGQHRSVFVAEKLAQALANGGWRVSIRHRELSRMAQRKPAGRVE